MATTFFRAPYYKVPDFTPKQNGVWARTMQELENVWFGGLGGFTSNAVVYGDSTGGLTQDPNNFLYSTASTFGPSLQVGSSAIEDPHNPLNIRRDANYFVEGRLRNESDSTDAAGAWAIYNPDSATRLEKMGRFYDGTGARQAQRGVLFNSGGGGVALVDFGFTGVGGIQGGGIHFYTNGEVTSCLRWSISTVGLLTGQNGCNMSFGTGAGTKIALSTGEKFAFHGSAPIVQEAVTGSCGGNAALIDLMTKLDNKGLIDNQTTT